MTSHIIGRQLTRFGVLTTHPAAFAMVLVYAGLWLVCSSFSVRRSTGTPVATLATWMMTLFITRSGHRDTQAIEAKLDELLRVHGDARNELMKLDDREPEEIEEHRQRERGSTRDGRQV
jgi:low affinity Fe/Cu permease